RRAGGSADRPMASTILLHGASIEVIDRRCTAVRGEPPFVEVHRDFSVSYVHQGCFGYRARGRASELVARSIPVAHPGDEYLCTHDHVPDGGDACLSFHLAPALADTLGMPSETWRAGGVPPRSELAVLGELAQAIAEGRGDVGLDEIGLIFATR